MAKALPAHLSYKSTLALLPPATLLGPIDTVRRVHDRHFARWPAHINLIYPFLALPSEEHEGRVERSLKSDVHTRVSQAVKNVQPFSISLQADAPGTFHHSKKSKTVWLDPATQAVQELQATLQEAFTECDADKRAFTPHLSLGQAHNNKGVQQLEEAIKKSIAGTHGDQQMKSLKLDWHVDRVYVLERNGFRDRFKIVGEITLGNQ